MTYYKHFQSVTECVCISCILLAIFLLLYPEAYSNFSTHFIGGARADSGIYIYLIEHHSRNWHTCLFNNLQGHFFYPFGSTIAYSDNFLGPGLLAVLLKLAGLSLVQIFNTLIIGATILNGTCTYYAARLINSGRGASTIVATSFAFSTFFYSQLGHPQLQFAFFLPLIFCAIIRFWQTRSIAWGSIIPACVGLSFLHSIYYALFTTLLACLLLGWLITLRPKHLIPKDYVWLCLTSIPWGGLILYLSQPYQAVKQAFGYPSTYEVTIYGGSLSSMISAKSENVLWGETLQHFGHYESQFFPGFFTLFMFIVTSCWTLGAHITNSKSTWQKYTAIVGTVCIFLGLCSAIVVAVTSHNLSIPSEAIDTHAYFIAIPFWIALGGATLVLSGCVLSGSQNIEQRDKILILFWVFLFFVFAMHGIVGGHWESATKPGIFIILREYFPGFDALRAVGRLGVVALFALVVISSIGFSSILEWAYSKRPFFGITLMCGFMSVVLLELRCEKLPMQAENPAPPAYSFANNLPTPGAFIVLPVPTTHDIAHYAVVQTDYMRALQPANRPMVNGYSGKIPSFQWNMGTRLAGFPSQATIAYLSRIIGLRYVIFDSRWAEKFDAADFEAKLIALEPQLHLLHTGSPHRGSPHRGSSVSTYVFELNAHLQGSSVEVFLPPDTKNTRTLHFEAITLNSPEEVLSHDIPLDIDSGNWLFPKGQSQKASERRLINRSQNWQKFITTIPPSSSAIKAHKVLFKTPILPNNEIIIFRKLSIDSP